MKRKSIIALPIIAATALLTTGLGMFVLNDKKLVVNDIEVPIGESESILATDDLTISYNKTLGGITIPTNAKQSAQEKAIGFDMELKVSSFINTLDNGDIYFVNLNQSGTLKKLPVIIDPVDKKPFLFYPYDLQMEANITIPFRKMVDVYIDGACDETQTDQNTNLVAYNDLYLYTDDVGQRYPNFRNHFVQRNNIVSNGNNASYQGYHPAEPQIEYNALYGKLHCGAESEESLSHFGHDLKNSDSPDGYTGLFSNRVDDSGSPNDGYSCYNDLNSDPWFAPDGAKDFKYDGVVPNNYDLTYTPAANTHDLPTKEYVENGSRENCTLDIRFSFNSGVDYRDGNYTINGERSTDGKTKVINESDPTVTSNYKDSLTNWNTLITNYNNGEFLPQDSNQSDNFYPNESTIKGFYGTLVCELPNELTNKQTIDNSAYIDRFINKFASEGGLINSRTGICDFNIRVQVKNVKLVYAALPISSSGYEVVTEIEQDPNNSQQTIEVKYLEDKPAVPGGQRKKLTIQDLKSPLETYRSEFSFYDYENQNQTGQLRHSNRNDYPSE